MQPTTFTVTRKSAKKDAILAQRYMLTIDRLPGRSWTHGFREMSDELFIAALISRVEARNLILDAFADGSASVTTGEGA